MLCPEIHSTSFLDNISSATICQHPSPFHSIPTMATTFSNPSSLLHPKFTNTATQKFHPQRANLVTRASFSGNNSATDRRNFVATLVTTASFFALGLHSAPEALAEKWGTRSFIKERFFEPGLSPEDAVDRIRQTAEGLHSMRHMLDTMSWRYVIFYIRLKQSYLSQDVKNAVSTLPENRRKSYVATANELVDNMAELDYYIRTPKVYESYLYYEKTLKSIDDLVALLA